VLHRDLEAPAVGAREQLGLPVPAVSVDRADGVDDEAGRQPPPARELRVAGGAAAERSALVQDPWPAGAVDHGLESVAFPSISTGAYRFPIAEAAPVALGTVARFFAARPGTLTLVRFVLFSEADLAAYERALAALPGPPA